MRAADRSEKGNSWNFLLTSARKARDAFILSW